MKAKLFLGLLVCTLVTLPFLAACTEPASAPVPTPTPAPAPAPTPTPAPQTFELIQADSTPPTAPIIVALDETLDKLEQFSNGRLTFVRYHGGSLVTGPDTLRAALDGTADITSVGPNATSLVAPLNYNATTLPFLGYKSMPQATNILNMLLDMYPEMQAEWEGLKVLHYRAMPPTQLFTTKKVVRNPNDIEGLKIGFTDIGMVAQVLEGFGAVPVQVKLSDLNMSLSSGLVDGWGNHAPVTKVFGALEHLPYYTQFGGGGIAMAATGYVINEKVFNSLPADLQKMLVDEFAELRHTKEQLDWGPGGEIETAIGIVRDTGGTITELNDSEVKMWAAGAEQIHKDWIAEMEAQGLPGQAFYDDIAKLVAEVPAE